MTAAIRTAHPAEYVADPSLSQWETRPDTARRFVEWARIGRGDHVLEPSAGLGNIVAALLDVGATVTAIEVDPLRVDFLRQRFEGQAIEVIEGSFLDVGPKLDPAAFSAAVMNPPYEKGQDLAHTTTALDVCRRVFLLARLALLESQKRRTHLWDVHRLIRAKIFSEREPFHGHVSGNGKSAMATYELAAGGGRAGAPTNPVEVSWW